MSGGVGDIEDDNVDTSVEDNILDQVEEATGVSFDDDEEIQKPDDEAPEEPTPEEKRSSKQAAPEAKGPRTGDPGKRDSREQIQRWLSARRRIDYDYNETGDMIDKEGKVVFQRDTPARHLFAALKNEQFERSRVAGQAQELFQQYNVQKQQLDAYNAAFKVAKDSGLSIQDQATAMENMAAFKKDPVQGLRGILHRFVVDGGDLSDIFDDLPKLQQSGLEDRLKGLAERIEAPQREQLARETSQRKMMANLNREVQTFFGENPLAENHSDTLAHIINSAAQKGGRVSLQQAWIRLMQFCNENNLRIDVPLKQQLEGNEQRREQPRAQQRPMPGLGRSNGLAPKQSNKPSYERSSRDIVDEAMREAGFDF